MSALGTKLRHAKDSQGFDHVCWFCPGCRGAHCIRVRRPGEPTPTPDPSWAVAGTPEAPIFSPSVLVYHEGGKLVDEVWAADGQRRTVCHCYVGGSAGQCPGRIEFLADCPHALAGQTVDLPAWPARYGFGGA